MYVHPQGKSYSSNGKSIFLDMTSLRAHLLVEQTLFDDYVETLNLGDTTLPLPISLDLIGIEEVFDIAHWQLMDQYVSERLCSVDEDVNFSAKRANLVEALRAYPARHNARKSFSKYSI